MVVALAVIILFLLVLFHQLGIDFRPPQGRPGPPVVIEALNNRVCSDPYIRPTEKHGMCSLFDTQQECLERECCGWMSVDGKSSCVHGDAHGPHYHPPAHKEMNYIAPRN